MSLLATDSAMPYEEYVQAGPVLVFLHGLPNNYLLWKEQLPGLVGKFHVLNFNLPRSVNPLQKNLGSAEIVDTIIRKLAEISLTTPSKRFILIGHDVGCFFLEEVGKKIPAHVQGQVFISGMGFSQYADRLKGLSQMVKSWYAFFMLLPGLPSLGAGVLRPALEKRLDPNQLMFAEAPQGFAALTLYRSLAAKLPQALRTTKRVKSTIPTLFITGDEDKFLFPVTKREASRFYTRANALILKGGHWVNRERPQTVNRALADFLQEIA